MNKFFALALVVVFAACGGDAPPAAGAPGTDSTGAATADSGAKQAAKLAKPKPIVDTGVVAPPSDLVREAYGYSFTRAARDPFRGLTIVADDGPELPSLRLVSVIYNHSDNKMSLATFRDNGNKKQYNVRPGDRIGRLLVVSIELTEATLRVNDFGTVREQTYSLLRAEDGKP